jgi:predicted transcriptional regulator
MPKVSTTSLKLDDKVKKRVQRLAPVRRRSSHWLMREAIEEYVEREEKRERFRQDVLTAWE